MASPVSGELRLGLIGAGPWGRNYISTIAALEGVTLARLASTNADSAQLVPPECRISARWEDVARARDLDGVIIAAPPALHGVMTRTALKGGHGVLVEKPLTLDPEEARELLCFAESRGGLVLVDHIHLFSPAWNALKTATRTQGCPRSIHTVAGRWGPFRADAPVLWDWGVHDIAMCLDLTGETPTSLRARRTESRDTPDGAGETLELALGFSGGLTADIQISNLMADKQRLFSVRFDRQSWVYDDTAPDKLTRHDLPGGPDGPLGPGQAVPVDSTLPLTRVVAAFAAALRARSHDLASLRLGVETVVILDQLAQALDANHL
ncbi:MAG: Gfo/Idh/MocA family oxidoreductase [Rhodospirillales bacterium]|nr:Gfo/Idh/MocA family oxidoreductase [Rhodospirillales bacterium]